MREEKRESLVELVEQWWVIAYPTDTIRWIGCDATNEQAVEKVYEIKNRPKEKSMIVLVSSFAMLENYGVLLDDTHKKILADSERPTTLIVHGMNWLASNVYHENGSVAVRVVDPVEWNPGAMRSHQFIEALGKPIVSTSANKSGDISPKQFADINPAILDAVDAYLSRDVADTNGQPSRVIDIDTTGKVTIVRE